MPWWGVNMFYDKLNYTTWIFSDATNKVFQMLCESWSLKHSHAITITQRNVWAPFRTFMFSWSPSVLLLHIYPSIVDSSFCCREYLKKDHINYLERNKTHPQQVYFRQTATFFFDPERSAGKEDDVITTLNIIVTVCINYFFSFYQNREAETFISGWLT